MERKWRSPHVHAVDTSDVAARERQRWSRRAMLMTGAFSLVVSQMRHAALAQGGRTPPAGGP